MIEMTILLYFDCMVCDLWESVLTLTWNWQHVAMVCNIGYFHETQDLKDVYYLAVELRHVLILACLLITPFSVCFE